MENFADYLFPAVLLWVGGAFTFLSLREIKRRNHLTSIGKPSQGIVFKLEQKGRNYHPVIRFQTDKQEWITHVTDFGSSPSVYQEGEKVKVMYDPNHPENMMIHDRKSRWLTLLFLIIGSGLLTTGIYQLLKTCGLLSA